MQNHISWNAYFMGLALLASKRSKDPNTKVGACIVGKNHHILSLGYNGLPNGCSDDDFPWEREGAMLDTKYTYVCHSEVNAIMNSNHQDLSGATLYVTLFPCNECSKIIIQSGIKHIVYLDDKYHDMDFSVAARRMLDAAGVTYEHYIKENTTILLDV